MDGDSNRSETTKLQGLCEKLDAQLDPETRQEINAKLLNLSEDKLVLLKETLALHKDLAEKDRMIDFLTEENVKKYEKILKIKKMIVGLQYKNEQLEKENESLKLQPETEVEEQAVSAITKKQKMGRNSRR